MTNLDANISRSLERQTALANILKRISAQGGQFVMYTSALGAIALIYGAQAPLEFMAASIGANLLSSIIDRVAQGEKISDENLQREVENAIQNSKLDNLLTKDDFARALSRLIHNQDKILGISKGNNQYELKQLSDMINELKLLLNEQRSFYRIRFDDSLTEDVKDSEFQNEVKDILYMMGHTISDENIIGLTRNTPRTFISVQDSDFNSIKTLFQCNQGFIDERTITDFYGIYQANHELDLSLGIIVTNNYIGPNVKFLAKQLKIKVITYENLLDIVFNKAGEYLKKFCKSYQENDKLFHTYVEIKYLRSGRGKFADSRATDHESLVIEAMDGSSFEAKGELTPYVDNWLVQAGNSQIFLLGEYGTGKTSFARQYFYKRASAYLENPLKNRVPLLVDLSRYHKSTDIEQMMTDFLVNDCKINRDFDTFIRLAAHGKLLVILDGFDEMAKQVDINVRRHNFKEIAKLLVGNNKVILSGRPNYFLTQAEIDEIFSQGLQAEDPYKAAIKKATSNSSHRYEILNVTLFDQWQIDEFLKRQSEYLKINGADDWRELQKTIYETYNLEELARTPVLLEIIIKTISEIRGKVSHINAAKLYEIYTNFWLDREYEKGEVRKLVTRTEKELFVLDLAWTMLLTDSLNSEIHFSQLSERVRNYFKLEKASEIEYFSSDIRFCSYLTHSEIDGNYKFIHKSFMEYFSARCIYKALFDKLDISTIITDNLITNEVFFFLCQMIDSDEIDLLQKLSRDEKNKQNKEFVIGLTAKILQQSMNIYEQKGAIQPAEKLADKLLQYSEEFDFEKGKLWGLIGKGKLKAQLRRYNAAEEAYREAIRISMHIEDQQGLSQSLIQLGILYQFRGNSPKSLEYYEKAITIFEEIGDRASIGQTLTNIGAVYQALGNFDKSILYCQQALVIFNEIGDRVSAGQTLKNVAGIYQTRGDINASLQYSQQALAIFQEKGDKRSQLLTLLQLGDGYQLTGNYSEALRFYEVSFERAQEIGDLQGESNALSKIGHIFSLRGDFTNAESYFQEALRVSERLGDQQGTGQALANFGLLYEKMARFEEAISLYEKSISISRKLGDLHTLGVRLYSLANLYSEQNKFSDANGLYKESLGIFEKIGNRIYQSRVNHRLGMLSQKTGDFKRAKNLYSLALQTNQEIGDVRGERDLLESLGDLAEAQQNLFDAETLYMGAFDISIKLDNQRNQSELAAKLGKLAKKNGNKQKTIEYYGQYLELARKMNLPLRPDIVKEYDQLQAKQYNLFINSGPVRDKDFFGRERELKQLYQSIQTGENLLLLGERRVGKTSLLLKLQERLSLPSVSVFVSLHSLPDQIESLLNGVIRKILEVLLKKELISPKRWEKFSLTYAHDFPKALESILDDAREKLKDIKIVLFLDDADRLFEASGQIVSVLRTTLAGNHNIVVITTATTIIFTDGTNNKTSPFFTIFKVMHLQPLSREDTEILINEFFGQAGVVWDSLAMQRIYDLAGGQPYYIQIIGHRLINMVHQKIKTTITLKDVNEILPEILEGLSMSFHWQMDQLSENEKFSLIMLAQGAAFEDIRKDDIQDLENRQLIIAENGSYRFASELFGEWVKQYFTIK